MVSEVKLQNYKITQSYQIVEHKKIKNTNHFENFGVFFGVKYFIASQNPLFISFSKLLPIPLCSTAHLQILIDCFE